MRTGGPEIKSMCLAQMGGSWAYDQYGPGSSYLGVVTAPAAHPWLVPEILSERYNYENAERNFRLVTSVCRRAKLVDVR